MKKNKQAQGVENTSSSKHESGEVIAQRAVAAMDRYLEMQHLADFTIMERFHRILTIEDFDWEEQLVDMEVLFGALLVLLSDKDIMERLKLILGDRFNDFEVGNVLLVLKDFFNAILNSGFNMAEIKRHEVKEGWDEMDLNHLLHVERDFLDKTEILELEKKQRERRRA